MDFLEQFYENEKERASTLIALSFIRLFHENDIISEKEYLRIKNKYQGFLDIN